MALSKSEKFCAKWSLLEFIKTARGDSQEYLVGRHTREITTRLDKAMYDFKQGKSTRLIITLPYRHGKSEICSRHLPPFFLGHFPELEVMLATYSQSMSESMSEDARNVVQSKEYKEIFKQKLDKTSANIKKWRITPGTGKFQAASISSGATGRGASLLIIDDYFSSRQDAESAVIRNKTWDGFVGNLFTRLPHPSIVIILATRWHPDDVIGRILKDMNPDSESYKPSYALFDVYKYPARDEQGNYLFTDLYPKEWYEEQFGMLGAYQSAALLQCEPTVRGGNILKTDGIQIIEPEAMPKNIRYFRFWDLASTLKERISDDPDWTSGALVGVRYRKGMMQIFVKHVAMCQSEAPERNKLIKLTAQRDTSKVQIGVESVAGYKDTYTTLKKLFRGRRMLYKITVSGDKVTRASILEAPLEANNVFFERGSWNATVIEQLQHFPAGAHDDHVDSIAGAAHMAEKYSKKVKAITA